MKKRTAFGLAVMGVLALIVGLFPLVGYDLIGDVDPTRALAAPSASHLLGTDHLGRDVLMRALLACRSFALPGLVACAVAAVVAIPAGAISGYKGGWVAAVVRYPFAVVSALPRFVLVLLACGIYGKQLGVLAIAAGLAYAPTLCEAVHARIESLRHADYVLANRAYGLSEARILWGHLVWAASRRLVFGHLLALFSYFLVLEATLSYLGDFGVLQPQPSWGNMLAFDWGYADLSLVSSLAPAAAIWVVIVSISWLQDALSEGPHG